MRIQHNIAALNSYRNLTGNNNAVSKNLEKLSSGYRINRAGDDAAGLKISEKMRSQIRGLDKASSNAQDGISLIQTAEGALNEAHSILQRMNELAVQGANDTNQSIDRDAINDELEALTTELDRISETTQFNKQNLLDGTFSDKKLQVGANTDQKIEVSIGNMNATSLGLTNISFKDVQTGTAPASMKYQGTSVKYSKGKTQASNQAIFKKSVWKAISDMKESSAYATQYDAKTGSIYYIGKDKDTGADKRFEAAKNALSNTNCWNQKVASREIMGDNFKNYVNVSATKGTTSTTIQVGRPSVADYQTANATLSAVQTAINKVSTQRSALGALQNRLEHTVANLDNVSENTSSAESRIRDTDMASEMVNYSKNNILAQAGQSMLAQANQSTQGVLSLLQ